jgi:KaiC/GvpD/RAD55 family RecA-like ATPase
MLKAELIAKSPMRVLEKSIEGGLASGNIGIIASKKGVGKTSVLVQIAIDKLLQGQKVIHVSFSSNTSHVFDWYENIFTEVAKKRGLEHADEVRDELVHNRVIMNFSQGSLKTEQILSSIRHLMVEGGIKASTLVIDGFDFQKSNPETLAKVHAFAVEMAVEIWFSATLPIDGQLAAKGKAPTILTAFMPSIAVLVVLEPKTEYIHFDVVKHHESTNLQDLKIKLDPKTLLIADV